LSRGAITKSAYESRIDELFLKKNPNLSGVKVLDRTELLGLLGYADKPISLAEGKLILGMTTHPNMTADVWKKIPDWLDQPAAVFNSDSVKGRLVFIAPELVDGNIALLIVEPKGQNELQAHLLFNAYDKNESTPPVGRWISSGLLRYADKEKFPAILNASGLQLSGTALQNKPGTSKILTEKNLNGYTKANPQTVLSRSSNTQTASERADKIIQTNAATAKPIDALVRGLTRVTGVERLTRAIYARAGYLLDRYTPETIKAGMVSDYGVPEAVIDQRAMMQENERRSLLREVPMSFHYPVLPLIPSVDRSYQSLLSAQWRATLAILKGCFAMQVYAALTYLQSQQRMAGLLALGCAATAFKGFGSLPGETTNISLRL